MQLGDAYRPRLDGGGLPNHEHAIGQLIFRRDIGQLAAARRKACPTFGRHPQSAEMQGLQFLPDLLRGRSSPFHVPALLPEILDKRCHGTAARVPRSGCQAHRFRALDGDFLKGFRNRLGIDGLCREHVARAHENADPNSHFGQGHGHDGCDRGRPCIVDAAGE